MRSCAALVCLVLLACGRPEPGPLAHPPQPSELTGWFPMRVGSLWIYDSEHGEVTFEVEGTRTIRGFECFEVVRTGRGSETHFFLTVTDKGVKLHKVGDDLFTPPFREFAFPLPDREEWDWVGHLGDQWWEVEWRNEGLETVYVPAGRYEALRIVEKVIKPHYGTTSFWLAEGVGVVKLEGKNADLHNPTGDWFRWELKRYDP